MNATAKIIRLPTRPRKSAPALDAATLRAIARAVADELERRDAQRRGWEWTVIDGEEQRNGD